MPGHLFAKACIKYTLSSQYYFAYSLNKKRFSQYCRILWVWILWWGGNMGSLL